ncbi:MAG: hypothetical protein AAB303_01190 [Chloroflexota bacterium]
MTRYWKASLNKVESSQPSKPVNGNVSIHAKTIVRATPQRTADSRRVAHWPSIELVMVWVVLRGFQR